MQRLQLPARADTFAEKKKIPRLPGGFEISLRIPVTLRASTCNSVLRIDIATAMEPVGVALGVIGLLPICADGCAFIAGLCGADRSLQEQVIRIRAQRAVRQLPLKLWCSLYI